MSGARAAPWFLVTTLLVMGLSAIATDPDTPAPSIGHECEKWHQDPSMITLPLYGGDVSLPKDFTAGARFLNLVEPPVFTRTEQALEKRGLQPGDLGDQGGEDPVVLERRHTDYSYMSEDWTGGMCLENVSGNPEEYICICDATFIFTNETGLDPLRPIRLIDSQYLWFDNLTVYGGGIDMRWTHNTITSNSLFIDSSGVGPFNSDDGYVHNISVIRQRPPTNLAHHPNIPVHPPSPIDDLLNDILDESPVPLGRNFMCWPHVNPPPCQGGGVILSGGKNWVVEWSYFHGSGGAGTPTNTQDITIRHNTFRDTVLQVTLGENEVAWNLVRGTNSDGTYVWSSDYTSYHNNSIIMPFKFDHGTVLRGDPGIGIRFCDMCDISNNDFIGYGLPHPIKDDCCPALYAQIDNHITANDNYWGTLHDPREPEDWWIRITHPEQTTLVLDRWETEPIHDITPLMYTLDHNDVPYWVEQLTGLPAQEVWGELPTP